MFELIKGGYMKRNIVLLMCGLLILVFFAGISDAAPSISVSPSSGYRGDPVTISGSGWTPNQQVSIYWIRGDCMTPKITTVKEDGTFSLGWRAPDDCDIYAEGSRTISAKGATEMASTIFQLLPGFIWVSPNSGPPGTEITISGNKFKDAGGHDDLAFFDGTYLGIVNHQWLTILPLGTLKIPEDANPGYHKIYVYCGVYGGSASTDFYVTSTSVPEYPTIAFPMVALIGLVFILQRHRINK